MKIKGMAVVVMVACLMVVFLAGNSHATAAQYTCIVNLAGPVTSPAYKVKINLTYSAGSPVPAKRTKDFFAPAGKEKEFLAVALTALANGKKVNAVVDFDTAASTTVFNLFMLKN